MTARALPARLTLTRHFFQDFFRLSFLDDAGEESFRRVIIGVLAGFIAVGLWLPRIFASKYGSLAGAGNSQAYFQELLADQLLMICLPMYIVAFVMSLVCHSLFPDETDYRILVPLPITRWTIFSAKLMALLLFSAIFIVTTSVAIGVPFSAISTGPLATQYWPIRATAQVTASILGSLFSVAAIITIQGLIVVLTPRRWLRTMSVVTQTALVCGLVLILPIALRVTGQGDYLQTRPAVLYLVPPMWFLGVQELALGNREDYFVRLAGIAFAGAALVGAIAVACYVIVYRRFDRVILRGETPKKGRGTRGKGRVPLSGRQVFRPEYSAVRFFTAATLRRSGLHQLVFLGVVAAGLALAMNAALGAVAENSRIAAVQWAPFVVIFAAVLGLRASLLLPAIRRAVWIFRLTERDERRKDQLAAVEHIFVLYGVVAPIVVALPAQLWVLGTGNTLLGVPVMLAMGIALVEVWLARWHRIPFTCTYLPGKRPVTHTFLLLLVSFSGFTTIGFALLGRVLTRQSVLPVVLGVLVIIGGVFRWLRLEIGENRPLEFEDEPPETSYGLRLNS